MALALIVVSCPLFMNLEKGDFTMVDFDVFMRFFVPFADLKIKYAMVQTLIELNPDSVTPELLALENSACSLIELCDGVIDKLDFSKMNFSK